MRINISKHTSKKVTGRLKKRVRIRKTLSGTTESPRLCVFKSAKHIYAQVVDDSTGKTLASASSLKLEGKGKKGMDLAALVGAEVAKTAKSKNITKVVFDRSGFMYHGKIKAVAEAARENGLKF